MKALRRRSQNTTKGGGRTPHQLAELLRAHLGEDVDTDRWRQQHTKQAAVWQMMSAELVMLTHRYGLITDGTQKRMHVQATDDNQGPVTRSRTI